MWISKRFIIAVLGMCLFVITAKASSTWTISGIVYKKYSYESFARVVGYTSDISSQPTIRNYVQHITLSSGKTTNYYVKYIEDDAFDDCTKITSITIGDSIKSCPAGTFKTCTNLKSIKVGDGNTALTSVNGVLYDYDKTKLICYPSAKTDSSYVVPSTVTSISSYAFYGCKNLQSLTIPESVTSIGSYSVYGCTLNPLLVYGSKCSLYGLDESSVVYQHYDSTSVAISETRTGNTNTRTLFNAGYTGDNYDGPIYFFEAPYIPEIQETYVRGVKFTIKENEYYTGDGATVTGLSVDGHELTYNGLGTYTATGLDYFEEDFPCEILMTYADMDCYTRFIQPAALDSLVITPTQAAATITIAAKTDATIGIPKEAYIKHSGSVSLEDTISFENNNPQICLTITDLYPNKNQYVYVSLVYDSSNIIVLDRVSYYTKAVTGTLSDDEVGPTSLHSVLDLDNGDFEIDSISWYHASIDGNITTDYTDFVATGLTPETSYTVYCRAHNTDKNWSLYIDTLTFTTSALSLVTEEPKVLSSTSASISAITNIDDIETNVGFEWRKTDAPDEVASKSATAEIYDGVLSGVIKGLSESTYYKYRAYYTSASDSTYYSDWVGIDTDDYSYFEPTVKTGDVEVSDSYVTAKGYALQGTEDIEDQGFEYWVSSSSAKSSRVSSKASDDGVTRVTVDGQKMTATLTDLLSGTTYEIRAYATTASSTTYGETVQFTTAEATGISNVTIDGSDGLELLVRQGDGVQIAVSGGQKNECNYRIFSITGSMVASGKVATDGNWYTIADANTLKGIYVIIATDGSETKARKLFVK